MKPKVVIVGAGRAGGALALALREARYDIAGIASRSMESARMLAELVGTEVYSDRPEDLVPWGDLVILSVPDGAISSVCAQIAERGGFRNGQVVAHLSGALSSDVLSPAKEAGAYVLSMHPIQTLAEPETGARRLKGSYFSLEGDPEAVGMGRRLVEDVGGRALELPKGTKVLYHAALCVASNYLVALVDAAVGLLRAAGVEPDEGLKAVLPLLLGTLENLRDLGLPRALTGPIVRGDLGTVRAHLRALSEEVPEFLELYRTLGMYTLNVAVRAGLDEKAAEELSVLL